MKDLFDLSGRVAVVTGGAGLLGLRHMEALLAAGATVVCLDLNPPPQPMREQYQNRLIHKTADVTSERDLQNASEMIRKFIRFDDHVDILVNNACNNPKLDQLPPGPPGVESGYVHPDMFQLRLSQWQADLTVGLTGPYLCSMIFGSKMAAAGKGVIVNVASELGVVAPDQRLYHKPGLLEYQQPVKPTSYSVVKHGLIGLTRWLATYWADKGVRVNALSPGGVYDNQPQEFVERYVNSIPLGRMAQPTDLQGALLFLCSEASSFMTGQNVVVDGGRTCW